METKMKKKGIFFSVGTVLVLFILFISFRNWSGKEAVDKEFLVSRAQLVVMENFVSDFDSRYIQQILATAARPAIIELSRGGDVIGAADFMSAMKTGSTTAGTVVMDPALSTDNNFRQALGVISFGIEDKSFTYEVTHIRQTAYDSFEIEFSVDYTFNLRESTWSRKGKKVIVPISVIGLAHPRYATNGTIDSSWVPGTYSQCYIMELFQETSLGIDCEPNGVNIQPPAPVILPAPSP
jgi:hypothetical protein